MASLTIEQQEQLLEDHSEVGKIAEEYGMRVDRAAETAQVRQYLEIGFGDGRLPDIEFWAVFRG